MKKNLIFKRINQGNIEMRVVAVDIPLNYSDGWQIASWCDTIEFVDDSSTKNDETEISKESDTLLESKKRIKSVETGIEKEECLPGGKYQSTIAGTARLVRYKGKIIITYRRGKKTFNQNDPNSVCISDSTKTEFFQSVKRTYGSGTSIWQLLVGDSDYEYWNNIIDKIYETGRLAYNESLR